MTAMVRLNAKHAIDEQTSWSSAELQLPSSRSLLVLAVALIYLVLVRVLRHRRVKSVVFPFSAGGRPLSSMTSEEALHIMVNLQTLEFPYSMNKARTIALLKVCPTSQ